MHNIPQTGIGVGGSISILRKLALPSPGQRACGVSLIYGYQEKTGWELACITWTPPCINRPHKQRNPAVTFYTAWYCTREPARRLHRKENKCWPCSDGSPITWSLQPGRHCSPLYPPTSPPGQADKSACRAGYCLSWGCPIHCSKGGRGLAQGRAASGCKI